MDNVIICNQNNRKGKYWSYLILTIGLMFLVASLPGCDLLFSRYYYTINCSGIKSNTRSGIERFTIALYERDGYSLRPKDYSKELARFCFEYKGENGGLRQVSFIKCNSKYKWSRCDLDLRFVTIDSLKDLTIEQKLELLKEEGSFSDYKDKMPFKFEKDTLYHIFGLNGIDGSYFMAIDENNKLVVDYFEGGPF